MSIGLYDQDWQRGPSVPNLEIMKLSSYYKSKREIVVLSPFITPERHSKFFVRQDYQSESYKNLVKHLQENVDFGGRAFSNGLYIPMDSAIETVVPDASIYEKVRTFMDWDSRNKQDKETFDVCLRAAHGRLSLDGKTVWSDFYKQFSGYENKYHAIFHDYDITKIENSFEQIQEFLSKRRRKVNYIGFKFPINVYSFDEFKKWASLNFQTSITKIRLHGILNKDDFFEFLNSTYGLPHRNIELYVTTNSFDENDFAKNYLPKIYRQITIQRIFYKPFLLKYEDEFFKDERWKLVFKFLNDFLHYIKGNDDGSIRNIKEMSGFDFIQERGGIPTKETITNEEAKEVFKFIQQVSPETYEDLFNYRIKNFRRN